MIWSTPHLGHWTIHNTNLAKIEAAAICPVWRYNCLIGCWVSFCKSNLPPLSPIHFGPPQYLHPTKIYQKAVYYKHGIWHLQLTHTIKTRWQLSWIVTHHPWRVNYHPNPRDGHPISQGWLPTIPWKVIYHPQNGHSPMWGQLSTIERMVPPFPWMLTKQPQDGHPGSPGWSPSIHIMVNHHPRHSHPPSPGCQTGLEFDIWYACVY